VNHEEREEQNTMAHYDNDPNRFRDPHGPVDPVDPAARPVDPMAHERLSRDDYPTETRTGPSAAAALIPILLLALVVAGAWWLLRTAPDQRGMEGEGTLGTTGYEAGPEAGIPGVVGRPGTVGTTGVGDGLVGVEAGDEVHLHDARITDVAGERTFWIEAGAGERMLVLAPHTTGVTGQIGDRRETFRAGQTVAIEGRVEQAGEVNVEGLGDIDRRTLESADGLVIRAMRVTGL
jgi:hypothetical protein